jgi:hypothetical protein
VWWPRFKQFADSTSRLCWLNTDSQHLCEVAILGLNDYLPWQSARVCFQNQVDFNYLEARHLLEDARIDTNGIHISGMNYKVLITEMEPPVKTRAIIEKIEESGRLIRWTEHVGDDLLLKNLAAVVDKDISTAPTDGNLRYRHVYKQGTHFYILFNEGEEAIEAEVNFSAKGKRFILDPESGNKHAMKDSVLKMQPHQVSVVMVKSW